MVVRHSRRVNRLTPRRTRTKPTGRQTSVLALLFRAKGSLHDTVFGSETMSCLQLRVPEMLQEVPRFLSRWCGQGDPKLRPVWQFGIFCNERTEAWARFSAESTEESPPRAWTVREAQVVAGPAGAIAATLMTRESVWHCLLPVCVRPVLFLAGSKLPYLFLIYWLLFIIRRAWAAKEKCVSCERKRNKNKSTGKVSHLCPLFRFRSACRAFPVFDWNVRVAFSFTPSPLCFANQKTDGCTCWGKCRSARFYVG